MSITNTFSVARGTNSSASKASSSAVSSGSLFDGVEPVKMWFPPMNKTILSYCLFSGKNSDRCRICAPGSDRLLKFGNRRCFNWDSAKIMFLVLEFLKIWNRFQSPFFHPSKLGMDGAWKKDRNKPLEPITGTGGLNDIVPIFKWSEITQFVNLFGVYLISLSQQLG